LILCSEWGDKSQIAAIALAANYEVWGIIFGGILAHCLCIVIALAIGKALKSVVTDNQILITGGLLFVVFGIY
jgi:putative Ca2+/H+ antiporter (TMEM165/GDT1 family)